MADVAEWLVALELPVHRPLFARHGVDGAVLHRCDVEQLIAIGVPLNDAQRIVTALRSPPTPSSPPAAPSAP